MTVNDYTVQTSAPVLPLELVPVPRHDAQITAQATIKDYVQTAACAWAPSLNGAKDTQKTKIRQITSTVYLMGLVMPL